MAATVGKQSVTRAVSQGQGTCTRGTGSGLFKMLVTWKLVEWGGGKKQC